MGYYRLRYRCMAAIQTISAACYTEDICISYVAFVAVHIFFLFFVVTLI